MQPPFVSASNHEDVILVLTDQEPAHIGIAAGRLFLLFVFVFFVLSLSFLVKFEPVVFFVIFEELVNGVLRSYHGRNALIYMHLLLLYLLDGDAFQIANHFPDCLIIVILVAYSDVLYSFV